MNSQRVFCGIALLLSCAVQVAQGGELETHTACGGSGVGGTYTESGLSIQFESCETATGFHGHVWDASGSPITEISWDGVSASYSIAGISTIGPHSSAEEDQMDSVLTSPEADLAASLASRLQDHGFSKYSNTVRVFSANEIGLETGGGGGLAAGAGCCTCESTDCNGCCGKGCDGCERNGFRCTRECLEHDDCVEEHGHIACLDKLSPAIGSFLECDQAHDCEKASCVQDPDDCCDGVGPACQ